MIILISLGVALFWVVVAWVVGVVGHVLGLGNVSIPWMIGIGVGTFVGALIGLGLAKAAGIGGPICSSK